MTNHVGVHQRAIAFHLTFLFVGIVLAWLLARSGIVAEILRQSRSAVWLSSFTAGLFFTWLLTAVPATIAFFEIAQHTANSIFLMALLGALGAVLGDLLIFRFLKFSIGDDLLFFFDRASHGKLQKLLQIKFFSITLAILGAIILASPLPDGLGLALMRASNLRVRFIAILSFVLNFVGILIIGLIARCILIS